MLLVRLKEELFNKETFLFRTNTFTLQEKQSRLINVSHIHRTYTYVHTYVQSEIVQSHT